MKERVKYLITCFIKNLKSTINGLIAQLFIKMEEKYNAICIRTVSYKDNDKMLTLFTLENGIVDCILRGVKKPDAKLKFAAEVFCFAEYVIAEKSGRRTVTEANQIDDFYDLRLDIDKYYAAAAIIEYVRFFCQKEENNYELFLNVVNAFKAIEAGCVSPETVLVKFYMEGLKEAGYGITFDNCQTCGKEITDRVFFDFDNCVFKCLDCADYTCTEMRHSTYKFLSELKKTKLSDLKCQKPTYSPTFTKESAINALKFYDFFIRDKIGVEIKSNAIILGYEV